MIFVAEDVDIVALLFQLVPLIKHLLCVFWSVHTLIFYWNGYTIISYQICSVQWWWLLGRIERIWSKATWWITTGQDFPVLCFWGFPSRENSRRSLCCCGSSCKLLAWCSLQQGVVTPSFLQKKLNFLHNINTMLKLICLMSLYVRWIHVNYLSLKSPS